MTEFSDTEEQTATEPGALISLKQAREQARGRQELEPLALVSGETMTQLPLDLYIPPDALEVFLETFEGPLDLLLYLIKKQNLNVLEINVFEITCQYMEYVDLMRSLNLELAADYLVMAAMLAEIKSRILLPRNQDDGDEDEEDPRAELIRRLQEYEQFKTAAENMDALPREGRDVFTREPSRPETTGPVVYHDIEIRDLVFAFRDILERAEMYVEHQVSRETLSTRERMTQVLDQLRGRAFVPFVSLFDPEEGKLGVVVTFLAIMELSKEGLLDLLQHELFGPIHVKARDALVENGPESELTEDYEDA